MTSSMIYIVTFGVGLNVRIKSIWPHSVCGGGITPLPPRSNGPALAVAVKQIASGSEMSHEEEEQSRLQPFVRCLWSIVNFTSFEIDQPWPESYVSSLYFNVPLLIPHFVEPIFETIIIEDAAFGDTRKLERQPFVCCFWSIVNFTSFEIEISQS